MVYLQINPLQLNPIKLIKSQSRTIYMDLDKDDIRYLIYRHDNRFVKNVNQISYTLFKYKYNSLVIKQIKSPDYFYRKDLNYDPNIMEIINYGKKKYLTQINLSFYVSDIKNIIKEYIYIS